MDTGIRGRTRRVWIVASFAIALVAIATGLVSCSDSSPTQTGITPHETVAIQTEALNGVGCSVLTGHNDTHRSGAQIHETTLTPGNVAGLHWIGTQSLDEQMAAQPLYLEGTSPSTDLVYAFTLNNTIYAVDPATARGGLMSPVAKRNLENLTGTAHTKGDGILSTPVIDPTTKRLYVVDNESDQEFYLYALDARTLKPLRWPGDNGRGGMHVQGTDPVGHISFVAHDPGAKWTLHLQRPALLFDGQNIYVTFGQHPATSGNDGNHDYNHYGGWVFAYRGSDLKPAAPPYCSSRDGVSHPIGKAGIWQASNGPAMDNLGRVYVATSDGYNDAKNDGEALMELLPGSGTLTSMASFVDPNFQWDLDHDLDFGGSGPVVLPTNFAPRGYVERVLIAGKQGRIYVMNPDRLSQPVDEFQATYNQYWPILDPPGTPNPGMQNSGPGIVSCDYQFGCDSSGLPSLTNGTQSCCTATTCASCQGYGVVHESNPHMHGAPVYLNLGGIVRVYWWGEKDYPRVGYWNADAGDFDTNLLANVSNRLSTTDIAPGPVPGAPIKPDAAMPGGRLSLSANGSQNGILWAVVEQDATSGKGVVKAFDAATQLSCSQGGCGVVPKSSIWATTGLGMGIMDGRSYPTVACGRVFVVNAGCAWCNGDKGQLLVYGL